MVPVIRSCQSPIWIWLVNYLHLHLHSGKTKSHSPTKSPCNQPAIAILTHAQTQHRLSTHLAYPLRAPHTHVSSRHQHWHCKASIVTQTMLPRDDQPTPAVHLSIPHVRYSACINIDVDVAGVILVFALAAPGSSVHRRRCSFRRRLVRVDGSRQHADDGQTFDKL